MLILKRNWNQSIIIRLPDGRRIVVVVVQCPANATIKLGIEADRDIKVHREELLSAAERGEQE